MQVVGAPVVKPSLLLYSDVDRKVAKKVECRWPALPYTLICHAALPALSKHQMPPSVQQLLQFGGLQLALAKNIQHGCQLYLHNDL